MKFVFVFFNQTDKQNHHCIGSSKILSIPMSIVQTFKCLTMQPVEDAIRHFKTFVGQILKLVAKSEGEILIQYLASRNKYREALTGVDRQTDSIGLIFPA